LSFAIFKTIRGGVIFKIKLKTILFLILATFFTKSLKGECPAIKMSDDIQKQFQIIFSSNLNALAMFNSPQNQKLRQLVELNSKPLEQFSCFADQGLDPAQLGSVMIAMKLKILQFRYLLSKNNVSKAEKTLFQLKSMMDLFLSKPFQLIRKLGASLRSLYLDELENIVGLYPELVQRQLQAGLKPVDISTIVEVEMDGQWTIISNSFTQKLGDQSNSSRSSHFSSYSLTSERLAHYFGKKAWRPKEGMTSLSPSAKWLHQIHTKSDATLEAQLLKIFRGVNQTASLKSARTSKILHFNIIETDLNLKHYVTLSVAELKKSPYFSLQNWLKPTIEEKLKTLKTEMGAAWPLISSLAGVNLEKNLEKITYPIELLSATQLTQAQSSYAKIKNPLGRLYEIVMLKTLAQIWSKPDMDLLRRDSDRFDSLKVLLSLQKYQKNYAQWPQALQDLVQHKFLTELPKDHFLGKELKVDFLYKQVWSVGENGIDEGGSGDDIKVKMAL